MDRRPEHTASKIGYLLEMDLFQDLSLEDLNWLNSRTEMVTRRKGQLVYSPEDGGEVLFLLKKGTVQIYRLSPQGKKLVITTLGAGTFFGEMSLIGQGMHYSIAEAVEDSTLCVMRLSHLEELIMAKPSVALRLLHVLGLRLLHVHRTLEDLAFKPVPARLAALLLRLWEDAKMGAITGFTHQDLADMIGTLRETTTEVLNHFKAGGLIEMQRMHISVLDGHGLRAIAEG